MKKIFILLLIICFSLPVMADTIHFTNGRKFVGCNFANNGDISFCLSNNTWHYYDCKDKGLCISQIVPDSKWDNFRVKWMNVCHNLPDYDPASTAIAPMHYYTVMPMGRGYTIYGN